MLAMLAKFRERYPHGSLKSELIDIERGLYIVKSTVEIDGVVIATGLAAAEHVEKAEDLARERAISAMVLDSHSTSVNQAANLVAEPKLTPSPNIAQNDREIDNHPNVVNLSIPQAPTKNRNSKSNYN